MNILICQVCGHVIRSNEKFCTGCSTLISKFSPTALEAVSLPAAKISASITPDPMILEKALLHHELGNGNGQNQFDNNLTDNSQWTDIATSSAAEPTELTFDPVPVFSQLTPRFPAPPVAPDLLSFEKSPDISPSVKPKAEQVFEQSPLPAQQSNAANDFSPPDFILDKEQSIIAPPKETALPNADSQFDSIFAAAENKSAPANAAETKDFFSEAPMAPTPSFDYNYSNLNQIVTPPAVPISEASLADSIAALPIESAKIEPIQKKSIDAPSAQEVTTNAKKSDQEISPAPEASGFQLPGAFKHAEHLLKHTEGNLEIGGRSIPKKYLALGGALIAIFILVQILSFIGQVATDALTALTHGSKPAQTASIEGEWNFAYAVPNRTIQGQMVIDQKGTLIGGEGRDTAYFVLKGTYDPPNVDFNKQYMQQGAKIGRPILYIGTVKYSSNGMPTMSGVYKATLQKGYFYNAQIQTVQDAWEAEMVKAAAYPSSPNALDAADSPKPGGKASDTLLRIAGILLLIGFGIVLASLKLFGPNGLINIWGKKEYIPSQFKSQHNKMLKELGKPIKPGGLPLGLRLDWLPFHFDKPKGLSLTPEMRSANPHILVLGAGDKGKSRLIASMIAHDIESKDRAVCVIDSDGTLFDLIVAWIASHPNGAEIAQRTILMDPTRKGDCPAYNPLELPENGDLQSAASAIQYGFKAIYTEPPGAQSQWNQQTANILRNSALLLMANGKTLIDLPMLLQDNDFRDVLLEKIEKRKEEKVEFITLLDQWSGYKRLARTEQWLNWIEPILNRVGPTLGDPRIRPILTKPKGDLNLLDVITKQKILLVKVPQGHLDQNANLLGALLVTGIKQAALCMSNTMDIIHPTALYLDEFDSFIEKDTVNTITSETRKFQIGLIAASKTLQHLPEDFRNLLIINVGTLCSFALAKKDGDMLGPQMFRVDGRKIKHQTIQNLFNRVNSSPQFELISDEEKLNIDRVVGQEERTFFCYRVGTVAGVFHLKSPEFKDIPNQNVDPALIEKMYETGSKS